MAEFPAQLFRMEGDPAAVRGSATAWSGFGATATSTASRIGSLDTARFIGTEGEQFRSILAAMPPPLGVTADAFGQVAAALTAFAGTLAGLQDEMRPLAAQAPGLWQRLQIARIRAATADPASKPAALAALRAAQAAWDACEAHATALQSAQTAAVQTAAAAVDRAAGMRFAESPGQWDLVGQARSFVQEHKEGLQLLSGGLKAVSLVAGLLSFTPLAPIALPVSLISGGLAAGIDLSVYGATGEGNLTDIAIDVGLTALPGIGRLARPLAGALAGAGRPLLANAYRAGSGIRAAIAAKSPQLFTRVRRALAFDPVDLVSGEMVLSLAAADLDTTTDAPEGDTTVAAPEGNATLAAPAVAAPQGDATVTAPEGDATASALKDDAAASALKDDATVTGFDDDITVASSDDDTTVTASDDATVTADTDEATAAEAGPEAGGEAEGARLSSVPAVGAETGGRPTGDPVEGSSARQRAERRWSGRRVGWIAGAAATAAAAVLAVVLLWPGSNLRSYPVYGTAAQPGASAVVTLDPKPAGVDISIEITGLPPSTEDTYYAAWLRGPEGTVPVGSFHWKKAANPISLWSGVEADRYPTFFITRQQEGDPPTPSADVVLQGQLA